MQQAKLVITAGFSCVFSLRMYSHQAHKAGQTERRHLKSGLNGQTSMLQKAEEKHNVPAEQIVYIEPLAYVLFEVFVVLPL